MTTIDRNNNISDSASDPALAAEWRLAPQEALKVEGRKVEGPTVQPFNPSTFQPSVKRDSTPGAVALHRLVLVFKGGDCILVGEV